VETRSDACGTLCSFFSPVIDVPMALLLESNAKDVDGKPLSVASTIMCPGAPVNHCLLYSSYTRPPYR
jgi:hypothetical protein